MTLYEVYLIQGGNDNKLHDYLRNSGFQIRGDRPGFVKDTYIFLIHTKAHFDTDTIDSPLVEKITSFNPEHWPERYLKPTHNAPH